MCSWPVITASDRNDEVVRFLPTRRVATRSLFCGVSSRSVRSSVKVSAPLVPLPSPKKKQNRQLSCPPPDTVRSPPRRLVGTCTRSSTSFSSVDPSGRRKTCSSIVSPGRTRRRLRSRTAGWTELADSTRTISDARCSWVIVASMSTLENWTSPNSFWWMIQRNA